MSKHLWLTEKPSQAKEIAEGLGESFTKSNGYFESPNHIITWAYGHLIELDEPERYNPSYKEWKLEDLPIFPARYKYHINENGKAQFAIIKSLLHSSNIVKVIVATDCGREGEFIARLILHMAGNKKPVFRFWVTMAWTAEVVKQGFADIKPISEFEGLYISAQVRQWADWLIGINATRAFTLKMGVTCSVGRVQTPVLAIIVKREQEIKLFQTKDYWQIEAEIKHNSGIFKAKWYNTSKDAENSANLYDMAAVAHILSVIDNQYGVITAVNIEEKKEKPLSLLSLTELQKECNKQFDLSIAETLEIAQSLYEKHKAISYPRTESKHLSSNQPGIATEIVDKLSSIYDTSKCSIVVSNKHIFDDKKITDHHALIPTGVIPQNLTNKEKQVYDYICKRFIAAFYPDYEFKTTGIMMYISGEQLKASGKTTISLGWREYFAPQKEAGLPECVIGHEVKVRSAKGKGLKTTPPPRFTEASITDVMENAARYVVSEDLKKILRETSGIGTPATRASIIETLKKREFIRIEKKSIVPTVLGIKLIDIIKDEIIADPAYTAFMEQELTDIVSGKAPDIFLTEVNSYTGYLVSWIKKLNITPFKETSNEIIGKCPVCGKHVYEYPKSFSCESQKSGGCTFILWKNKLAYLGKETITTVQGKDLLAGRTIRLRGLMVEEKTKFDSNGKLAQDEKYGWYVKLIFEGKKRGK